MWRHVVRELREDHRCVVPTLPLGAHRRPMRPDADLSPRGIAQLEVELLQAPRPTRRDSGRQRPGLLPACRRRAAGADRAAGHHLLRSLRELPARVARARALASRQAAGRCERPRPTPSRAGAEEPAPRPRLDGQQAGSSPRSPTCWLTALDAAGDPPRRDQVPSCRQEGRHARGGRAAPLFRPSVARRLGGGSPGLCPRAREATWPSSCRTGG